jgi:hypothetical protein
MTNRDSLHQLVDTLPEASVESVERLLQMYQKWPPEPPAGVKEMSERMEQDFTRSLEEHAARTGSDKTLSFTRTSRVSPGGDRSASQRMFEGETAVSLELRVFCGHKLDTEERLRLSDDKQKLVYNQFIKGPNGKEGRYEIEFDVPEQRPRVDGA